MPSEVSISTPTTGVDVIVVEIGELAEDMIEADSASKCINEYPYLERSLLLTNREKT